MLIAGVSDFFQDMWYGMWLFFDKIFYSLMCYLYRIFLLLAKFNPFSIDAYQTVVKNVYVVIGVIMLFLLTYSLLKAVINPDEFAKGEANPQKLILNIVTSVIILIVLPTCFKFMGYFQSAIIDNDFLGNVILGTENDSTASTIKQGGMLMAERVYQPFFFPDSSQCGSLSNKSVTDECAKSITIDSGSTTPTLTDGTNVYVVENLSNAYSALIKTGDYSVLTYFIDSVKSGKIAYLFVISTIVGIAMCYVIFSFAIDLGIRVAKLIFLQIIAPVPVIFRAMPKGKDVFNNWVKMLAQTYANLFIRVGAMYIGVEVIVILTSSNVSLFVNSGETNLIIMLANALIVMGVVAFAKESPKMLAKLFPFLDGQLKLGIKDKLAAGGAFAIGGAVGAGGAYAANKLAHMPGNLKKFKNDLKNANSTGAKAKIWANAVGNRFGNGLRFGRSVVSGGVNAKGAKDLKSMNSAAKKGAVSGLTAPGVIQDAKNGVVDTYQALSTFNKTEFSPVASKRSIEQANKLDEVKKKHDLIIDALDKSDNVKAVDDFYEGQIKQLRESGGYTDENGKFISYTSDELIGLLSKVQKEWRGKKDTAREVALKEKMTVNDFEMNGLLQSYAATLKENENILVEAHSKVKGEKLSDEAFDNVTQDMANNFKTFNELGKSAGKYSGELRRIAIEEEQKNNGAK
jgi:hypothetical protein